MTYRGFEIKHTNAHTKGTRNIVIFKNGVQYSSMCFGSEKAAERVIDNHLGKVYVIESFLEPVNEPENLRTVGTYSNKQF